MKISEKRKLTVSTVPYGRHQKLKGIRRVRLRFILASRLPVYSMLYFTVGGTSQCSHTSNSIVGIAPGPQSILKTSSNHKRRTYRVALEHSNETPPEHQLSLCSLSLSESAEHRQPNLGDSVRLHYLTSPQPHATPASVQVLRSGAVRGTCKPKGARRVQSVQRQSTLLGGIPGLPG